MNPISTRLCKSLKIGLPDWTFLWTLKPITLLWSAATEQPEPHKETIFLSPMAELFLASSLVMSSGFPVFIFTRLHVVHFVFL